MFDHDTNVDETISRRSVLKTTAGLIAGSTALAGIGAGRGAAETEEGLRIEVREFTEEYIAVSVAFPNDVFDEIEFPNDVFLGLADQFEVDSDTVSLPENTEGLANPAEVERLDEQTYRMYFRTRDSKVADFIGQDYIEIGLGVFPERTMPRQNRVFDTEGLQPGTY